MQKLTFFFLAAFSLFISTSCTEDNFSQVVDISIPEHVSLPSMTMEVISGDTILYPFLSRSYGVTARAPMETEPNSLRLFRNGELIGEVNPSINESRFDRPNMLLAESIDTDEATYELVGEITGLGTATATQVMPAAPTFTVVSFERQGAIDEEGFRVDEVLIDIQDPAGVDNYYGFNVRSQFISQFICDTLAPTNCDTVLDNTSTFVTSPDPLLVRGGKYGMLLSDQSFSGSTYRVRIQFEDYQGLPPLLQVYSLTEDTYRYSVSFEAYQDARDNPFAEPVSVHDNITDGYGFFLISNRRVEELRE